MRNMRSVSFAASLVLASASMAGAQGVNAACPAGTLGPPPDRNRVTQDACQKTIDFFQFMAPQLGTSIVGGNTTMGQGGALGGLGHFAISVRGNVIPVGGLPRLDQTSVSYTGAVASNITTDDQLIGLPAADVAVGIFRGLPLGLTNVGGIDLLVSGFYVPEVNTNNVTLKPKDGSLKIGYGARLGVIQESALVPGVGISYIKRDLPTMTLTAQSGNSNFSVSDLEMKTSAWRITAGKSLLLFGLTAGFGQDKYESSTNVQATVSGTLIGTQSTNVIPMSQSITRNNMFIGASMNLLIVKLVAEAGRVSGGTVNTYNSFGSQKADDPRTYFSAGVRFGF